MRRLLSSTSGNVAFIFALCAPVMMAATGIAIDMSRLQTQNLRVQKSLDAAALAAAKEYGTTQDTATLTRMAENYFFLNLGRDEKQPTSFSFDGVRKENGQTIVRVSAKRTVPMLFGPAISKFYGGNQASYTVSEFSEIVVQNRSIEMALVLDNSGSMRDPPDGGGQTKIVTLRSATTDLVNQIMKESDSNVQYPVSVSVVPFSGAVNVDPNNKDKPWMDTKGLSPEHHDDLDWRTGPSNGIIPFATEYFTLAGNSYWRRNSIEREYLTRFYLYDKLKIKWDGCVMSRPNGRAVTDDAPSEFDPSTLFVPTFAPSEYFRPNDSRDLRNSWIGDDNRVANSDNDFTILKNQADVKRYLTESSSTYRGPNFICNTRPLTPLTKTRSTVLASISKMEPSGGTNIMEGLAWGWRTLTSREPFPEGKPAKTADNLKVIVLMTDGENTYNASNSHTGQQVSMNMPGKSLHGTYGYGQILNKNKDGLTPGRMFDSTKETTKASNITQITAAMNENMSIVCENAKADGRNEDGSDGIVIFTIAFDLDDESPVKERLRKCASNGVDGRGEKLYYDARSAADLNLAFRSITEEISSLRISR